MSIDKVDKHFLVICQLYDEIKKLTCTKTSDLSHKNVADTRCSEDREFLENLLLSQRAQNEELVKNMEGLKSEFKSSHSFMKNDVLSRINDISKQNDSLKSLVIKLNNDVLSLTNENVRIRQSTPLGTPLNIKSDIHTEIGSVPKASTSSLGKPSVPPSEQLNFEFQKLVLNGLPKVSDWPTFRGERE